MAYRKTEKILAGQEKNRKALIAAAIKVIEKGHTLTTDAVAARAKVSVGLIYKHFADKTELIAAVTAQILAEDIEEMHASGSIANSISVLFRRVADNFRLMKVIGDVPLYRDGMQRELARMLRGNVDGSPVLAALAYGAIFEVARIEKPGTHKVLSTGLLRAFGLRERV